MTTKKRSNLHFEFIDNFIKENFRGILIKENFRGADSFLTKGKLHIIKAIDGTTILTRAFFSHEDYLPEYEHSISITDFELPQT